MNIETVGKMKAITEATLIPISLVITLLGGVMWMTTLHAKTEANAQQLSRIEQSQIVYLNNLQEINIRLSRIEGALKRER